MALTVLNPQNDNIKSVKVRITADTVITRDGRGVPIYTGSVLSVTPTEANLLMASMKAERAKPEDEDKVLTQPHQPDKGAQQKAGIR